MFAKTHLIFWTKYQFIFANSLHRSNGFRFNSKVVNRCFKSLKNAKKFKQRNVSIFSWVYVYKNVNVLEKVPIYPYKFTLSIKWFWLNSTVPNLCLKILKNVSEFKQRNVSIFYEGTFIRTQLAFFNKVSIYPSKFTSSIKWFLIQL